MSTNYNTRSFEQHMILEHSGGFHWCQLSGTATYYYGWLLTFIVERNTKFQDVSAHKDTIFFPSNFADL